MKAQATNGRAAGKIIRCKMCIRDSLYSHFQSCRGLAHHHASPPKSRSIVFLSLAEAFASAARRSSFSVSSPFARASANASCKMCI